MSWLLKQAEDILNRVDQQANATINQHATKSSQGESSSSSSDAASTSSSGTSKRSGNASGRLTSGGRRQKKDEDSDLFDYLNSSTPASGNKATRHTASSNSLSESTRTASSPNMIADDATEATETSASKSASTTPRSTTPATPFRDDEHDDQGLVLVRNQMRASALHHIPLISCVERSSQERRG